jgi:hypothetical protein
MTTTDDTELIARVSPTLQARYLPLAKGGVRLFDFMGGRRSGKTWFILQKLIGRTIKGDIVSVATMTENQGEMGAYADAIDIINGSPSVLPYVTLGKSPKVIKARNGGKMFFKSYTDPERAKGIKCDSIMTMTGGDMHITTSGEIVIETIDGIADTSSCAAIKVACLMTMAGGNLTVESSGDGGKGINADSDIVMTGGTLTATCTGEKVEDGGETVSNAKAVNSHSHIYLSGGTFTATSANGRATDNAIDDIQSDRYPIIKGTPTTKILSKKKVVVIF